MVSTGKTPFRLTLVALIGTFFVLQPFLGTTDLSVNRYHHRQIQMIVDGQPIKPIWLDETSGMVKVIDQRQLPHRLVIMALDTVEKVVTAIQTMAVRGAPLLGVTGA